MPIGLNANTAGAAENSARVATRSPDAGLTEARGRLITGNGVEQVHLTRAEPMPAAPAGASHHAAGAQLADYNPKLADASEVQTCNDFFTQAPDKNHRYVNFPAAGRDGGNALHRTGLPGEPGTINARPDPRAEELQHAQQDIDRVMGAQQYDPSGSRSRVAGAPEKPLTSRLDRNAADLFRRHGLPAPRKDIKIPILNITIIKRDTELKALFPKLEAFQSELAAYYKALETDLVAQTPRQRAETVVRLNEQLDSLEQAAVVAAADLARLDSSLPGGLGARAPALVAVLEKLPAEIDNERSLVVDVGNNFSMDNVTFNTPVTWQHALEFKRVGLNLGGNVQPGAGNSKTAVSAEPFGSGACNTVHQVRFADGSAGIFKFSTVDENPDNRAIVADLSMIPEEQPRYGARNVASCRLDKLLGTGVLADSEFFVHEGQLGVLMEKVEGTTLSELGMEPLHRMTHQLYKDLTALQVLDAVTGQHDRHFDNAIARADPAGNYLSLKGIDNDNAFGASPSYNDLRDFADIPRMAIRQAMVNAGRYQGASYNVGLPPVIDAGLADKILADDFMPNAADSVTGLLSAGEMEMMADRLVQLREHVQQLKDKGRTVADWESGETDNGASIAMLHEKNAKHSYAQALVDCTR